MTSIEYIGNAGDGFMVHIAGRAPRFIEPHAFLSTFGVTAFEDHILRAAKVTKVTDNSIICSPSRFPDFEVVWRRTENGLDPDNGVVRFDRAPFTHVSAPSGGFEKAQEALNQLE